MKKAIYLMVGILLLCSCSQNSTVGQKETVFQEDTYTENLIDLSEEETLVISKTDNIQVAVDKDIIKNNLEELCSTIRNYGSDGERKSCDLLDKKLTAYGYNVHFQDFPVYKQTFDSTLYVETSTDYFTVNPYNSEILGTARNIIARRSSHNDNKKTIYLTAHYDTTTTTTGVIDNGTGVSVILEAARIMRKYDCSYNIEIVLFSAEEYYRSGSRAFISNLTDAEKENTIACINVDMVGEKDAGEIVMLSFGGRHNIISLMCNSQIQLLGGGSSSDDLSFYMSKLPVVTLTNENSNPALAKEKDQFQYVEIDELVKTVTLITDFLYDFDNTVYSELLKSKTSHNNDTAKGKIVLNNSFKLVEIKDKLLENGYDSETEYIYMDDNQRKFMMTERVVKFVSPSEYSFYKVSKSDEQWAYSIKSNSGNNAEILYKNDSYIGEIKGDISLEEAIDILNSYCKSEYKRIFDKETTIDFIDREMHDLESLKETHVYTEKIH